MTNKYPGFDINKLRELAGVFGKAQDELREMMRNIERYHSKQSDEWRESWQGEDYGQVAYELENIEEEVSGINELFDNFLGNFER